MGTPPSAIYSAPNTFNPRQPVAIPDGLPPHIHARVSEILEQNSHIKEPQIPAVLRLVRAESRLTQIGDELDIEGISFINARGDRKVNPLLTAESALLEKIASLERILCIAIPSRRANVTKAEENESTKSTEAEEVETNSAKVGAGAPRLRLA